MGRIMALAELEERAAELRRDGRTIAFANGHFDLLHVGHLRYLQAAREQAEVLIVGLNDDLSVTRLKGVGRPLVPAAERAELLAALRPVDFVVVFAGDSPAGLLATLQPDVHCKGTDYGSPEKVPEYRVVRAYGGRTVLVGDPKDHATSDIISAVRALPGQIMVKRCSWAGDDPLYIAYHDDEWGVPVHDDRTLFEFLILEGAQAGLSWITILKKRESYRRAFDGFDPRRIARYREARILKLLGNAGIVRNRLKVRSTVTNAKAFLAVEKEFGSFDRFIWQFVGGRPKVNAWKSLSEVPASTPESDAMAKELKRRGFKFVGSTICYAYMQAVGMVNDHTVNCFRYREVGATPASSGP